MADDFCVNIFDDINGVVGEMTGGLFNGQLNNIFSEVNIG